MSSAPIATVCASAAMPALPGAASSRPIRGLLARLRTSACSRAPPPTTKTFSRPEAPSLMAGPLVVVSVVLVSVVLVSVVDIPPPRVGIRHLDVLLPARTHRHQRDRHLHV